MAPPSPKLLFIPGLHKITAGPGPRPSPPAPSSRAFCPSVSRHALVTPPTPSLATAASRANPPRGRRAAPQAVVAPASPPSAAARSTLHPHNTPLLRPRTLLPPSPSPDPARVAGHKHTAESKRKISAANRGNVPWNKGRHHTEETKRKISEATRRAMLQPEMRRLLKERAKGRKHSEATKLKIRETARATRGGVGAAKRAKKLPVPFTFPPEVVADLNDKVQRQLETSFKKMGDSERLMVREKRPMADETKAKLSAKIKELWSDPQYRTKVAEGIEQRAMRVSRARSRDQSRSPESSQADADPLLPLVSTKVKREPTTSARLKSPKRRARVKTSSCDSNDDNRDVAVFDEIDASEIFIDPESLEGITKEDLGIYGSHGPGRVDTGSSCNDPVMTDADSDDAKSRVVPDNALREHTDLLTSLANAGHAQHLDEPPYMDVSRNHGGFGGGLNAEVQAPNIDPLDVAHANDAGHAFARGTSVSGYRQDSDSARRGEVLDFFDDPAHPISSSATEPSPFVSVGSAVDEDRISPAASPNFDFSSGGEHLMAQNTGSGYVRDNLSLNYADENFGGLDIYNEAGTSFENALRAGPSVDFDRQSGQLAKNPGKGK